MNTRMKKDRLRIGTYCLQPYARTEAHVRELAGCGIDFVIGVERDESLLDLLEQYGVGAVVNKVVPGWFGGTGANAGRLAERNPLDAYKAAAERFRDHPAIWGIDVGDEPSCRDFPHYGKVVELVERLFPEQFAYLNLYADYGMVASGGREQAALELGTGDYARYLEEYCYRVRTDYICFDHYMFTTDRSRLTENLRLAAAAAQKHGRELWVVLQVNSLDPKVFLSEDQLYLQVFTALAFGVRCISWACYTPGWWHNHVLDGNGEKTEQYEKLKRVNESIHALSDICVKYRWEGVCLPESGEDRWEWGCFREVQPGGGLLVGLLGDPDRGEKKALFLAAGQEREAKLGLRTEEILWFCTGEKRIRLAPDSDGMVELTVPPCKGGILTGE